MSFYEERLFQSSSEIVIFPDILSNSRHYVVDSCFERLKYSHSLGGYIQKCFFHFLLKKRMLYIILISRSGAINLINKLRQH